MARFEPHAVQRPVLLLEDLEPYHTCSPMNLHVPTSGTPWGLQTPVRREADVSTHSTSLPAIDTFRIKAPISSGIGGMASRWRRPGPDQTKLTWSDSSSIG